MGIRRRNRALCTAVWIGKFHIFASSFRSFFPNMGMNFVTLIAILALQQPDREHPGFACGNNSGWIILIQWKYHFVGPSKVSCILGWGTIWRWGDSWEKWWVFTSVERRKRRIGMSKWVFLRKMRVDIIMS